MSGKKTAAQDSRPNDRIRMTLFVAGEERNSQAARTNLARICKDHLHGRVDVEIVDVLKNHRKALEWRVLLTPALLIFNSDHPARVTGTLQEPERVLSLIDLDVSGAPHG